MKTLNSCEINKEVSYINGSNCACRCLAGFDSLDDAISIDYYPPSKEHCAAECIMRNLEFKECVEEEGTLNWLNGMFCCGLFNS